MAIDFVVGGKEVFDKALMGEICRDKLQHFYSRIELYYPEREKEAAYALLDHLSVSDKGESRNVLYSLYQKHESQNPQPRTGRQLKQAFNHLLMLLKSDFYIEEGEGSEQNFSFSNRLLKLWWRKYYG